MLDEDKRELTAQKQRERLRDLHERCVVGASVRIDGVLVRGFVDRVKCRGCKIERWNDGTKCPQCGTYENVEAGKASPYKRRER